MKCHVCFRHCDLPEGAAGFCHARGNRGGKNVPLNYGIISSLSLDPIEKKPLNRFCPGSHVLSLGSFGCNMACPFCQNYEISTASLQNGKVRFQEAAQGSSGVGGPAHETAEKKEHALAVRQCSPEEICEAAWSLAGKGNIGAAYTYNEALAGYEFVRDTARLVHARGMKNVLVSNGCVEIQVLEELLPYIDAMNIDLKSFREEVYRDFLKGDLPSVKAFIRRAAPHCHMEITTLLVPGMNDTEEEVAEIAAFIHGVEREAGREIPLHISRFFPRYRMRNVQATPVGKVYRMAEIAREHLHYVYTGNC